jgi:hypothetical protein
MVPLLPPSQPNAQALAGPGVTIESKKPGVCATTRHVVVADSGVPATASEGAAKPAVAAVTAATAERMRIRPRRLRMYITRQRRCEASWKSGPRCSGEPCCAEDRSPNERPQAKHDNGAAALAVHDWTSSTLTVRTSTDDIRQPSDHGAVPAPDLQTPTVSEVSKKGE